MPERKIVFKSPFTGALQVMTIQETLEQRGTIYGPWETQGIIAVKIKDSFRATPMWEQLADHQKEALDMIANKISRILNADFNHADSWHDIAGYATLVENILNAEEARSKEGQ